ncbi:MAG TPA: helix-turn-helix domain-containing GNAT family N-acetyltransferase [Bryobacteraceae bacterium]|jgi:DNA-binding MarR family transcriptional regulator
MNSAAVRQVRSFNRTVAERLGALSDRFLRRRRPMGEARLLWEIGKDGVELRQLRERLGLDSGYLSRALHSLEDQGLVKVRASRDDRRVRLASLTKAGREERAELDRLSDGLAVSILESLSERQRLTLVTAMGEVERLLEASMVSFAIEEPAATDAAWCLSQYFAELNSRFESGFDPALSISADASELTPPAGILVVARLRGRPIGCGAVKFHGKGPAELKRMWIAPGARGLGVGRRLLAELERHAFKAGARVVRLETNRALKEAVALYTRSGYVEVDAFSSEPYADHWFEKRVGSIRSVR